MALLLLLGLAAYVSAQTDEIERVRKASEVFTAMMSSRDSAIPQAILDKAEAVAVFPDVFKAAFVFGGERGRGIISVRNRLNNTWSPPAFLTLTGGSWGAQVGGESSDLVLIVMNRRGLDKLMRDQFKVGGEAEAAAGPVGRNVQAATDAQMHAEILSYSHSRGVFAGISLSGASMHQDIDANEHFYGKRLETRQIVYENTRRRAPHIVAVWRDTLDKYFVSDRAATSGRKDR
jgi:lipid-binding SYLF domain-containing protein